MTIIIMINSYRECIAKLCMALWLKIINGQYSVLKGCCSEDGVPLSL